MTWALYSKESNCPKINLNIQLCQGWNRCIGICLVYEPDKQKPDNTVNALIFYADIQIIDGTMNLWKEKGDQILMDAKYIDSLHYYKSRSKFCCLIMASLTRFSMLANDFTWLSMQYIVCLFLSVNLRFHVKLDKRWSWAAQYCTATNERQVAAGDFFRPPQCRFVGGQHWRGNGA